MARLRILSSSGGCYHAISRIVDRRFRFGPGEKEFFVRTMRRLEEFLDVRVLTYCVMSNHFHLLVEVPGPEDVEQLTSESLRSRLPLLYHGAALVAAQDELDQAVAHAAKPGGSHQWLNRIVARYQARMGDLSTFVKELKWRFSRWYNQHNDRIGTLWEDRFRTVFVEGGEHCLMTIAAYIDLNPVRAGLVEDPADYRWCGYGEAVADGKLARRRLARLHGRMRIWQIAGRPPVGWRDIAARYRIYLFGQGVHREADETRGTAARHGLDPALVEEVISGQAGRIPPHEALRKRIRHFRDGAVLGSAAFVESVFEENRGAFGPRRKTGTRKMRNANWGDLATLREIRD